MRRNKRRKKEQRKHIRISCVQNKEKKNFEIRGNFCTQVTDSSSSMYKRFLWLTYHNIYTHLKHIVLVLLVGWWLHLMMLSYSFAVFDEHECRRQVTKHKRNFYFISLHLLFNMRFLLMWIFQWNTNSQRIFLKNKINGRTDTFVRLKI